MEHSFNDFAVNCFVDEIAASTGTDPLDLRMRLLTGDSVKKISLPLPVRRGRPVWDRSRLRRVLVTAAEHAGWGTSLPAGRGRGIACGRFKRTYTAHVVEVSVHKQGAVRVERVVSAIDCGRVVNPDGVAAQIEGSVMDGVATVLHWGITLEEGRVREGNFDDYPLLRIDEAPHVEIHIVPSEEDPSGTGEPPYPGVPPAITNALFAATGRRVRKLPLDRNWMGD